MPGPLPATLFDGRTRKLNVSSELDSQCRTKKTVVVGDWMTVVEEGAGVRIALSGSGPRGPTRAFLRSSI